MQAPPPREASAFERRGTSDAEETSGSVEPPTMKLRSPLLHRIEVNVEGIGLNAPKR